MLGAQLSEVPHGVQGGTAGWQPSRSIFCARSLQPVLALVLCCGVSLASGPLATAAPASPGVGVSDAQSREDATRALPLDQLNQQVRAKILPVVSKPSIYRRLPVQVFECDPDLYVFLIRYPEVIVNMWQLLGITKVQVKRTGQYTFHASDGAGTVSNAELVYGRADLHVYYAEATYEGPLLRRRTEGSCVLLLRSGYTKRDDRVFVSHVMDVFVRMDDTAADIVARTLQPVVAKAVDNNFIESTRFVSQVSQAAEMNGPGMQILAGKLTNIDASVRQNFAQQADGAYQKALLRANQRTSSQRVEDKALEAKSPVAATPRAEAKSTLDPNRRPASELRR